jgi:hypothetical protein
MLYLYDNQIQEIIHKISVIGRNLELYTLKHICGGNYEEKIIEELLTFQNNDGGFGQGLEPDFVMPYSSPIATALAFEYIDVLDKKNAKELIRNAINYLQKTYNPEIMGWHLKESRINFYPHAIWWHWNEKDSNQNYNINPTLRILGVLYKYREFVDILDLKDILDYAVDYVIKENSIENEHDIYSIIYFYNTLDSSYKKALKEKVKSLIKYKIDTKEKAWKNYVPMPINFIDTKKSLCYKEFEKEVEKNLDFIITSANLEGFWQINWNWGQYPKHFKIAKMNWSGYMAIRYINLLKNFDRIRDSED